MTAVVWEAPGGGQWELDSTHMQGAQPRLFQELAPQAFSDGFARAAERYGIPIQDIQVRFVNEHLYGRVRPVGAPEPRPGKAGKAPPDLVLKVLARVHPELRRRNRAATLAIEEKRWLADRDRWVRHHRPQLIATSRALQSEELTGLDDVALVDHLGRAAAHYERGMALHFELMPVHDLTVGLLVLACRRWGIADRDVFDLLGGSSPASVASADSLRAVAQACADADVDPRSLDDIRRAGPEASRALDHYLADHGWRVVSQYSPRALALVEIPGLIVEAVRAAASDGGPPPEVDAALVRARVPAASREVFDDLLADARACYGVRDDNVALNFMWPAGLVRRAILEVGRRLVERGVLREAADAMVLTQDELAAGLSGDASLGLEAATRLDLIARAEADGAPAQLGDDEGPPPDPGLFPEPMAEVLRAIMLPFELEGAFQGTSDVPRRWSGEGVGIGTVPYTGRACVASDAEVALTNLRSGDVLVTTHTSPAFEAVMSIAGALVTEHGGLMSHAAIVCREHGIPAVIGVTEASEHIADGSLVTVDPVLGRILLDTAPG